MKVRVVSERPRASLEMLLGSLTTPGGLNARPRDVALLL